MVIASLRSLLSGPSHKREAQSLYIALVQQSRKAFFYTDCAVPDTLDGRFDIILLHIFLQLRPEASLQSNLPAIAITEFHRMVLETFFDDMDRSLREMGVGDMGVGKRIKKMAKSVFGRLEAYKEAFSDDKNMREALIRNVYRGAEVEPQAVEKLLSYTRGHTANP